ncbi:hypothetical protein Y888_05785 [Mixta calida B021323]|nr:hypothetical protein Y888_05785 [Mixta calida B021323]
MFMQIRSGDDLRYRVQGAHFSRISPKIKFTANA